MLLELRLLEAVRRKRVGMRLRGRRQAWLVERCRLLQAWLETWLRRDSPGHLPGSAIRWCIVFAFRFAATAHDDSSTMGWVMGFVRRGAADVRGGRAVDCCSLSTFDIVQVPAAP